MGLFPTGERLSQIWGQVQWRDRIHLATELRLGRSNVYRWVNEARDPTAETVKDIVQVLRKINPSAAEEFIRLYLGDDSQQGEEEL